MSDWYFCEIPRRIVSRDVSSTCVKKEHLQIFESFELLRANTTNGDRRHVEIISTAFNSIIYMQTMYEGSVKEYFEKAAYRRLMLGLKLFVRNNHKHNWAKKMILCSNNATIVQTAIGFAFYLIKI